MATEDARADEIGRARDTLWSVRPEVRRGRRPTLTLAAIVDAALGIARSDGLAAVTMAAVARSAGCAKMALYRHVSNRDDLLAAMVDAALGEPPAPHGDWQQQFRALWSGLLDLYDREPWMLDLPADLDALTPRNAAWIEAGLRPLERSTLAHDARLGVVLLLTENARAVARHGGEPDRPTGDLDRLLSSAVSSAASSSGTLPSGRYPLLTVMGEHLRDGRVVVLDPDMVREMLVRAVAPFFPGEAS